MASNIGMMDSAYFVGRNEILTWINNCLQLNLSRIEEVFIFQKYPFSSFCCLGNVCIVMSDVSFFFLFVHLSFSSVPSFLLEKGRLCFLISPSFSL